MNIKRFFVLEQPNLTIKAIEPYVLFVELENGSVWRVCSLTAAPGIQPPKVMLYSNNSWSTIGG